ncbi:uncharacterized protein LOC127131680 [Lathyrus oleraceus]|uniref:uncharacterized protein LOC127131680 n=1 Tax=Pisum sativum TaxID=3888 RepID=UPI0021D02529|nr:uncharacterized protein LOC127131680 [Pisum sativum]
MAGRNDVAIADALQVVAQAVQNQPNAGGNNEFQYLRKFQRNNPPTFKGRYDPDGAHTWLREIERIFRLMDCSKAQKMRFGTHMEFLRKYFPEDVRGKKEIEFLELKQGNLSVIEYAARFVELAKF